MIDMQTIVPPKAVIRCFANQQVLTQVFQLIYDKPWMKLNIKIYGKCRLQFIQNSLGKG
jgi:hypothetical protein